MAYIYRPIFFLLLTLSYALLPGLGQAQTDQAPPPAPADAASQTVAPPSGKPGGLESLDSTGKETAKSSAPKAHLPPGMKEPPKALGPPKIITPVKVPDATMRKLVLEKYAATQTAAHTDKDTVIKQAQTFPANPSCVTAQCHAKLKDSKAPHYPAQTGRCLACHLQTSQKNHPSGGGAPDFKLAAAGGDLCYRCHSKFTGKKFNHDPAQKGDCLTCHDPHGTDNPFLLNVAADTQQALCKKCHEKEMATVKFPHGPVGLGACTFCHDPHASDYKGLLKNKVQDLCFECHSDIAQGVKESPSVHEVVKTAGCTACHQPHGSDFPHLLKQESEEFCFTCHQDIEEKMEKGRSRHAGVFLKRQCGTCHQPHYSAYDNLLISKEEDLCLSCHGKQKETTNTTSKSAKDIAAELKKTFVHAPVAKGECSVCHDPHGSKYQQLLTGPYPDTFYAPFDPEIYGLCFKCHDQSLLTEKTTDKATNFRNGNQNLHYLHAAISRKGRTCETCHQPHASDGPKLISRTGTHFGEWQMPISFALTTNGGTCMPGCHRKMEYDRNQAINNAGKTTGFGTYHVEYKSVK